MNLSKMGTLWMGLYSNATTEFRVHWEEWKRKSEMKLVHELLLYMQEKHFFKLQSLFLY